MKQPALLACSHARFTFSYEELDMDPARLGDYELIWQDPDGGNTGLDLDG